MATAAAYSAEQRSVDSVPVVRLADNVHATEVFVCPSVGNIAYDMRVHGKPILLTPPGTLGEWKAKPVQAGIPLLAPWANRMDPDSYWANGRNYHLNPDAASLRRDSNGLSIHGLLLFASDWRVFDMRADSECAETMARLDVWKHPEWMAQFPFAHAIEITHRLAGGVLEVRTAVENHSREPMPLSIGFHPWYQVPDYPRDEWTVHLPVREHYVLSSKLIPTGETKPAQFADRLALRDQQLDDVFGGVSSTDEFYVEGGGQRISVRFGPKFTVAVIYAPQTRNVICFEPMTGITNAFNLAHAGIYKDLQNIAPGSKWVESFWIRPSGF